MTRPTSTRVRVQSTAGDAPRLNDSASIGVPSMRSSEAADVAQQLLSVMGLGANLAAQRNAEQTAQAAKQKATQDAADTTQAESDFTSGVYDDSKALDSQAYRQAHSEMFTRAQLAMDSDELASGSEQFIANHDQAGLVQYLQEERAKRWTGIEQGEAADLVNDHYAKLQGTLLGQLQDQAKIDTSVQDMSTLLVTARGEYQQAKLDGKQYDLYGSLNDSVHAMFKTNSNDALFNTLQLLMEQTHDPSIIDNMPDKLANGAATLKAHPKYAKAVAAMRNEAAGFQTQEQKDAVQASEFRDTAHLTDSITAGRYPSDAQIEQLGRRYSWSAEQMLSWHNRRDAAIEAARKVQAEAVTLDNDFANGWAWQSLHTVGEEKTKKAFDDWVTRSVKAQPEGMKLQAILSSSARNGLAYRPLADKLNYINMQDAEQFKAGVDLYASIKSSEYANVLPTYIPTDATRKMYETALVLRLSGKDIRTQMEAAGRMKEGDRLQTWNESDTKKSVLKQLGSVELADGRLRNVQNKDFARRVAYTLAEAYGSSGLLDTPDEIIKAVSEDLKLNSVVINDRYYPRTADMPTNINEVMAWYQDNELPKVGGDEPVSLIPDSRGYGVYHKGTIDPVTDAKGNPIRATMRDMVAGYNAYQANGPTREATDKWSKLLEFENITELSSSSYLGDYQQDRSKLSPQMRSQLDPLFTKAAKSRMTDAQAQAENYRRGASALNPSIMKDEQLRSVKRAEDEARQWQDLLSVMGVQQ